MLFFNRSDSITQPKGKKPSVLCTPVQWRLQGLVKRGISVNTITTSYYNETFKM